MRRNLIYLAITLLIIGACTRQPDEVSLVKQNNAELTPKEMNDLFPGLGVSKVEFIKEDSAVMKITTGEIIRLFHDQSVDDWYVNIDGVWHTIADTGLNFVYVSSFKISDLADSKFIQNSPKFFTNDSAGVIGCTHNACDAARVFAIQSYFSKLGGRGFTNPSPDPPTRIEICPGTLEQVGGVDCLERAAFWCSHKGGMCDAEMHQGTQNGSNAVIINFTCCAG